MKNLMASGLDGGNVADAYLTTQKIIDYVIKNPDFCRSMSLVFLQG